MVMGRLDLELFGVCRECNGKKVNRKKRTEKCPECCGTGKKTICSTCKEEMPCMGTSTEMFDQTWCLSKEPRDEWLITIHKEKGLLPEDY